MDLFSLARMAGIVGGLCWVARFVLGLGSGSGDLLYLAGAALISVAMAGGGAGLVSTSAVWLRAIVAIAFPLLAWSVITVLHGNFSPEGVDALLGVGAVIVSFMAASRVRRKRAQRGVRRSRSHGTHAR